MNSNKLRNLARGVNRYCLVGLTAAALMTAAWAETPHFSGPSMTRPAAPTVFSGKGFAANSAVTVMVKAPSGAAAGFNAVTTAEGALSYTLVPIEQGAYTISVTNSGGQTLAKAVVAVLP